MKIWVLLAIALVVMSFADATFFKKKKKFFKKRPIIIPKNFNMEAVPAAVLEVEAVEEDSSEEARVEADLEDQAVDSEDP
ncbi:unnamed protein product [Cyprideis torosa]|uniref:Uncharacterized protein n=1 Tax=Cyprideis torosa TaxID=163714 RepID=A0A7R8WFL3_9CRUS|nr:unnamed protein product [Cyprideis torosa]CAG0897135.1 unnamed protein product [Cyprideis torosa]